MCFSDAQVNTAFIYIYIYARFVTTWGGEVNAMCVYMYVSSSMYLNAAVVCLSSAQTYPVRCSLCKSILRVYIYLLRTHYTLHYPSWTELLKHANFQSLHALTARLCRAVGIHTRDGIMYNIINILYTEAHPTRHNANTRIFHVAMTRRFSTCANVWPQQNKIITMNVR